MLLRGSKHSRIQESGSHNGRVERSEAGAWELGESENMYLRFYIYHIHIENIEYADISRYLGQERSSIVGII